ncbi:MAG: hypothetical protein GY810_00045 [Aureispira sp.]|nr:hypothetical protein [Aureispira sp.]
MFKQFLAITLFAFLFNSNIGAQNLLINGKFATNTEGWSVLLADKENPIKAQIIERADSYKEYGLADNYIGTNFVEIDAQSGIQQTVDVKTGETYILAFATAHRPDVGNKQFIIQINGDVVHTKTFKNDSKAGNFSYRYVEYTAKSDQAKIAFRVVSLSGADDQGVLLTDILFSHSDEVDLSKFSDMKY